MAKYKNALPKLPARGYFIKGDKGAEVKKLQQALNWANSGTIKASLKVDGILGDLTVSAVSFYEEVHTLTIDGHFGNKCLSLLKILDMCGRWRAVNWAISIAKDNRFTYGTGKRAHRNGCYFCQTNVGPRAKNKERKGEPHVVKDSHGNGHTYAMTYCCNTFITAAYAHGAKDSKMLKHCRACNSCGMNPSEWVRHGAFKNLGRASSVPYEKLIAGDVIITSSHVWMYIGGGRLVEASGGTWSSSSIATKTNAKGRYTKDRKSSKTYVVRYTA